MVEEINHNEEKEEKENNINNNENNNNIINELINEPHKEKEDEKENEKVIEEEILEEEIISQIISKIQKPKKSKKGLHIQINLDNNIIIGYIPNNLINEYAIMKSSSELIDKTSPLNRTFSTFEKIFNKGPIPVSSII